MSIFLPYSALNPSYLNTILLRYQLMEIIKGFYAAFRLNCQPCLVHRFYLRLEAAFLSTAICTAEFIDHRFCRFPADIPERCCNTSCHFSPIFRFPPLMMLSRNCFHHIRYRNRSLHVSTDLSPNCWLSKYPC